MTDQPKAWEHANTPVDQLPYAAQLVTRLPYAESELREVIAQAIGEASICWSNLSDAGMFDSTRAAEVNDDLVANVLALTELGEPSLGCATTEQLLDELRARADLFGRLSYRTVD